MKTGFCNLCGKEIEGKPDGRKKYCTECRPKYYKSPEAHRKAARKYQKTHPEEDFARRVAHQKFRKENNGGYKSHSKYSNQSLVILCECPHDHPKKHNHHPDYSKPLDIMRGCPPCHREWDKKRRDEQQLKETA